MYGLHLEGVLEKLWRTEIQDDVSNKEMKEIKFDYIYKPFLNSFKDFKKDIKNYKELTDSKLKVDNSKLGYIIIEIVDSCKRMIEDVIKDEINEKITDYELEEYYEKYIDMVSFSKVCTFYDLFGDVSDNDI
jgi:hypothetical protein